MLHSLCKAGIAAALAASALAAGAATVVATYNFDSTLAALESGAPSLVAIDPLGLNGFESAVVFGNTQQVYHWVGDGSEAMLIQRDAGTFIAGSTVRRDVLP